MEILERVRALTLAGQQRAAAGEQLAVHRRVLRCCLSRAPVASEHAQVLWTRRRAAPGADRALPSNMRVFGVTLSMSTSHLLQGVARTALT